MFLNAFSQLNTLRLEGFARLVDLALNDSVFMLEVIAFHVADQETQRLLCLVMLALFAVKDCRPATHEQINRKAFYSQFAIFGLWLIPCIILPETPSGFIPIILST
jgi:hypothetical protein